MDAKTFKKPAVTPQRKKLRHVANFKDVSCHSKGSNAIRKLEFHFLHCRKQILCMKCSNYCKYLLGSCVKHTNACKDNDCKVVDACLYLKLWMANESFGDVLVKLYELPILSQQILERLVNVKSLDKIVSSHLYRVCLNMLYLGCIASRFDTFFDKQPHPKGSEESADS